MPLFKNRAVFEHPNEALGPKIFVFESAPYRSEIEQGGLTDTNDYGTSTCIQVAAAPGPRAGRQATVPLGEELHLPETPLEPLAPARNTGGEGSDPCY